MRKGNRLFTPMGLQILAGLAEGKTQAEIAAALHLAQPAISKHLGMLEREAGIPFVHREGRRIRLTATGRQLADTAKAALAMLDELELVIAGRQSAQRGVVRVVASSTPGGYALPAAVAAFLRSAPEVKVELDVRPLSQLWRAYDGGAYDFAVVPEGKHPDGLWLEELYRDPLVVFAHPAHPLAQRGTITVADLVVERLIGRFVVERGFWRAVFRGAAASRARAVDQVELISIEGVKRMVETGVGVGILYESSVRREIEEGRLCRLNVADVDLSVTYYLAGPEHQTQTPATQRFARFVREYFAIHAPAC